MRTFPLVVVAALAGCSSPSSTNDNCVASTPQTVLHEGFCPDGSSYSRCYYPPGQDAPNKGIY